ncbi:MAG: tetratricopeptide repeat protein [Planctomycetes bacterium]|nr:tetratricopeptide repeat protein [Planctomycetota bacterium]
MATKTLPRSAQFLIESDTPNLNQIRLFHRLAQQDVHERRRLKELQREGLAGVKNEKKLREGILAFALGFHADAEELFLEEGGDLAAALIGLIFVDLDEHEDAIAEFKKAGALPEAKVEIIRALVELGKVDEAKDALDQLPESADAEYLAGRIAELENRVEIAINAYESAVELDGNHVEAAFKLGVLLDRIGDDDMAIESLLVCADIYPHYLPGVVNLGVLYEERGEANAAVDCFRQALAYNSENRRASLLLRDAKASRSMFYDEREEKDRDHMTKILRTPVNEFELSVRSRNCLAKMNIFTLGDLISITEQEMLNYKNFGETSLKEVREMLTARNLRLGQLRENETRGVNKADQKVLADSVDKLELSEKAMAVLEGLGVSRIGDIQQYSDIELYRVPNSGQSVVQELTTALAAIGVTINKPEFNV